MHAPELFANSSLLDLASKDKNYLKLSIDNIKKVIEITLELKKNFQNTKKPLIIANAGGYSMDKNFDNNEKEDSYGILSETLNGLKDNQYEIIQKYGIVPVFGGQRFQNL